MVRCVEGKTGVRKSPALCQGLSQPRSQDNFVVICGKMVRNLEKWYKWLKSFTSSFLNVTFSETGRQIRREEQACGWRVGAQFEAVMSVSQQHMGSRFRCSPRFAPVWGVRPRQSWPSCWGQGVWPGWPGTKKAVEIQPPLHLAANFFYISQGQGKVCFFLKLG